MAPEDLLACFATEINTLADRRLLTWDSILDGSWNKCSWLHARMFGALVRSVTPPFVPMVEVKWHRGFVPDLCVVDERDKVIGVVEYESTNSSDERLFGKDLCHFEEAILEYKDSPDDLPCWWLLISTLPRRPVRGWPWYADKKLIGWNIATDYPPAVKSKQFRDADPLAYYKEGLHVECERLAGRLATAFGGRCPAQVIWANLDGEGVTVENVAGVRQQSASVFPLRLTGAPVQLPGG